MSSSFSLVILSAVFHAGWNVFVKESRDKVAFSLHIQVTSAIYLTAVMAIFFPEELRFDKATVIYALLSAFFFAAYQILVAEAYRFADVSMVYPITTSSPLFIIVWAYFFLGERITLAGFIGIILIIIGCYIMNMTGGGNRTATKGLALALTAALVYSFGAMADKLGVTSVNTMLYIYLMELFMAIYSYFLVLGIRARTHSYKKSSIEWKLTLWGGLFITLSTVCYRLGLMDMQISYASALRQASSFFGLLAGIFFFKESYGLKRALGCGVIISGIVLIRLGM